MKIRFAEVASNELVDARDWYEQQQTGLGLRFKDAVHGAAQRIARTPLLFPVDLGDVRRYVLNRFPYTLRYVLRGDEVWVVAVSHHHRRPDYWAERINNQ